MIFPFPQCLFICVLPEENSLNFSENLKFHSQERHGRLRVIEVVDIIQYSW